MARIRFNLTNVPGRYILLLLHVLEMKKLKHTQVKLCAKEHMLSLFYWPPWSSGSTGDEMGPSTEPWLQVQERGPLVLRKSTPGKGGWGKGAFSASQGRKLHGCWCQAPNSGGTQTLLSLTLIKQASEIPIFALGTEHPHKQERYTSSIYVWMHTFYLYLRVFLVETLPSHSYLSLKATIVLMTFSTNEQKYLLT